MRSPSSRLRKALGATAILCAAACATPSAAQDGAQFVAAKDLAAKLARTTDGVVNFTLPAGPGGQTLIVRRDGPGLVEVHARFADQFIVKSGKATVLVGGSLEGDRETAPGERRGGKITGGKPYALAEGDVLWIPAGVPHQVTVAPGDDFTYYVAKFAKP